MNESKVFAPVGRVDVIEYYPAPWAPRRWPHKRRRGKAPSKSAMRARRLREHRSAVRLAWFEAAYQAGMRALTMGGT